MPFLAPRPIPGGAFQDTCTVRLMGPTTRGSGMGGNAVVSTLTHVPCSLQAMSSGRMMLYKVESQTSVWDLMLPARIENGATGGTLTIGVGTEFVVGSVTYRSIGEGVLQGVGGTQLVGVEKLNK